MPPQPPLPAPLNLGAVMTLGSRFSVLLTPDHLQNMLFLPKYNTNRQCFQSKLKVPFQ